jgi:hypothetical protein
MTEIVDADGPATPLKKLPYFTNHSSHAWTLDQVHQAFNQVLYSSFDYVPGKGKKDESKKTKITILNAHVINGVLHFFEKAAGSCGTAAVRQLPNLHPRNDTLPLKQKNIFVKLVIFIHFCYRIVNSNRDVFVI